ncbi:MAG TPA: SAM-dependent methyltransferase [Pseudonocardiaceae bacterium]|nr:SAM-dependent methyltransferase [Pseudonocardiaceae bacterium]
MAERAEWIPSDVDPSVPSAARIYDALLGGEHNFAVDREFAQQAQQVFPGVAESCRANRSFLARLVRHLVEHGVRQFLDIGSGIPTSGNVHEVAQRFDPTCRVVYVDNEPVAVAHSEMLLQGNANAKILRADMRDPDAILRSAIVRDMLDFDQPIAVFMLALLHFIPDGDDPAGLVARYREALPPGSYLAISHATAESRPDEMRALVRLYASSSNPAVARSNQWITDLFGDFALAHPGTVYTPQWRPGPDVTLADPEQYIFFGGLARK